MASPQQAGSSLPLPGGTEAAATPTAAGSAIQGVDLSSFGDLMNAPKDGISPPPYIPTPHHIPIPAI